MKIAFRLISNKTIAHTKAIWFEDVDEDFTNKKSYISYAKELTKKFNEEEKTSYSWKELFDEPKDIGYRYCSKCDTYFWDGEECNCDE